MIIAGLMGSVAAAGGGGGKSAELTSTYFEPLNEAQQQTMEITFTNWDGSDAYWMLVDGFPIGNPLNLQVDNYNGQLSPGTGTSVQTIHFTPFGDQTTEGSLSYYLLLGASYGASDYFSDGPHVIRDGSQTPTLVLDVDPASITTPMTPLNGWYNTEGDPLAISNGSKSADNGGTLVFNGTSTYVSDAGYNFLTNATYGTITLSAWIKPIAVGGSTQTIIAKELCYKIIITINGSIAWMTAKGYEPWEITAYVDAGILTAGAWAQVVATVNADYTRIYVNGVKITETTGNVIGANNSTFNIGAYDNTNDLFAGSMGEIKVWNYAITEATVITEYNTTAARYGRSPIPYSLDFPAGNPYLLVSNTQSDWNLGTTYTIEFWSKEGNASNGAIRTVASQGPGDGIDLGFMNGGTLFRNTQNPGISEPTAGVWTHVAFVGNGGNTYVYHNGELKGTYTTPGALADGSSDLNIGRRAGVDGQGFYGKLAMIRISEAAKYLDNFSPSLSYGVEVDTNLMLGSNNPLTDLALYELNGLTTSATNGTWLYFSKATYPDLNNQIHAGDTVVDAANPSSTSTLTGEVFTPNGDPNNWGVAVANGFGADTVNFSGPGRHPVSVQGAVTTSTDFPSYLSLEFNQPQGDYLSTPASADWNLGNNWTIEFWIKSNNNSANNINIPGGQWGLINQGGWYGGMPDDNCILIGLTAGALTINQSADGDISFVEPTTRVWTHVAIVNNGGGSAQKVYYNGVEQTPLGANYTSNGKTNTTEALYIGRLKPIYESHFDGKMAMVRISNTAKYLTAFTATTTYGVEADTKLFLGKVNPTVDSLAHAITNNGVTTSTSFPS